MEIAFTPEYVKSEIQALVSLVVVVGHAIHGRAQVVLQHVPNLPLVCVVFVLVFLRKHKVADVLSYQVLVILAKQLVMIPGQIR